MNGRRRAARLLASPRPTRSENATIAPMSSMRAKGFMSGRLSSRARRRPEYAAARVVGSAADPDLAVRARRRLLVRDEFGAADDPAIAGHGDPVGSIAVVVVAAQFAGRIANPAAIDPGVMRGGR